MIFRPPLAISFLFWVQSTYATEPELQARQAATIPNDSSLPDRLYAGCYIDINPRNPLGPFASPQYLLGGPSTTLRDGLTWAACNDYCASYTYAGLIGGITCRCGNAFAYNPILLAEAECSSSCSGAPSAICGGLNRITVFIKKPVANTLPSALPQASALSPSLPALAPILPPPVVNPGLPSGLVLPPLPAIPPLGVPSLPPAPPNVPSGPLNSPPNGSPGSLNGPPSLLATQLSGVESPSTPPAPSAPPVLPTIRLPQIDSLLPPGQSLLIPFLSMPLPSPFPIPTTTVYVTSTAPCASLPSVTTEISYINTITAYVTGPTIIRNVLAISTVTRISRIFDTITVSIGASVSAAAQGIQNIGIQAVEPSVQTIFQDRFLTTTKSVKGTVTLTRITTRLATVAAGAPAIQALDIPSVCDTVTEQSVSTVTQVIVSTVTQSSTFTVTQRVTQRTSVTVTQRTSATVTERVRTTVTQRTSATVTERVRTTVTQRTSATVTQRESVTVTRCIPNTLSQSRVTRVGGGGPVTVTVTIMTQSTI